MERAKSQDGHTLAATAAYGNAFILPFKVAADALSRLPRKGHDTWNHLFNPLHVRCRLHDLGVSKEACRKIATGYERWFYAPINSAIKRIEGTPKVEAPRSCPWSPQGRSLPSVTAIQFYPMP